MDQEVSKRELVYKLDETNPEMQHDTLQVRVAVEYTGPASDIESPSASLVDGSGEKIEALSAKLMSNPGDPPLTGPDDPNQKVLTETLEWINPAAFNSDYKKKPRALKTGDKFSAIYLFQDSKEYSNLKFVFNDVPPPF